MHSDFYFFSQLT